MALPKCPSHGCDEGTLEASRVEAGGVIVAVCNCCGQTCRVLNGRVVHRT